MKKCNHPFETIFGGKCEICGKPVDEIIKQLQAQLSERDQLLNDCEPLIKYFIETQKSMDKYDGTKKIAIDNLKARMRKVLK